MRIAITGTRGVPNTYGGFEMFAGKLSTFLNRQGHETTVYSPHYHPYKGNDFNGVKILRKRSPEVILGAGGNYLYDFSCLKDAIRREVDVILECGYASAAPWYPVLRRKGIKLVTHMDGMEWQREKWGKLTRKMFRRAERTAVKYSDSIVCDNPFIADYYRENYSVTPEMIPYGAEIRDAWDEGVLDDVGLKPGEYYLMIARLEPENNMRMIIEGYLASGAGERLVVVGSYSTKYGRRTFKEYSANQKLKFMGGIFNQRILDHLRHYSTAVLHGHSVGGTNPSLLEAMAAGARIIAHDNPYNKWVLGENALFFNSAGNIRNLVMGIDKLKQSGEDMINNNLERIRKDFQWESVIDKYEKLFTRLVGNSS